MDFLKTLNARSRLKVWKYSSAIHSIHFSQLQSEIQTHRRQDHPNIVKFVHCPLPTWATMLIKADMDQADMDTLCPLLAWATLIRAGMDPM